MRIPPSGPSAPSPGVSEGDAIDDDGADPSIATGEQRVLRPRGAVEAEHARAIDRDPEEERREREREGEDGGAGGRGGGGKKRRKPLPRQERVLVGARDELVASPEHTLLPRAPTVARDDGPTAEPGDLTLTDPEGARHALRTPHAYAKHCMILAEAFRRATGATRAEGLAYLARLFVALSDPVFGRAALKELGPSTGIIDLYPLELVEHVIDHYPSFLPKVARGRFVRRDPPEVETFSLQTDRPVVLHYREELKVRGFAVIGGARPGYRFEPVGEGAYALSIDTPGRYTCAVSCLSKTGQTVLDRLELRVHAGARARPPLPIDADLPRRDPDKIAAWPIPEVVEARREDALSATEARRRELESRFSADELAQRIGVLGLANLRARLAARRASDESVLEETHPSWAAPAQIVIETEADEPPRAPGSRSTGPAESAGVKAEHSASALDELPVAAPRRRRGAREVDGGAFARARARAGEGAREVEGGAALRARARAEDSAPAVDVGAARALLSREGAVHDARREGPMVAAPHGLGRVPSPQEPLDDDGVEGEEPTSDLDPDATEALDRGMVARELAGVVSYDPEPTRPIPLAPPSGRAAPGVRLIDPEPTRPIDLASAPAPGADPEPTRPIELAPLRPRAAVIVRTVEEVDRTRPMDRDAVARVIGAPKAPSSEPETRPIVIDASRPRPTAEGPGFADVRPHDRTQPIPARRPRADAEPPDDADDEPGDHTLAELED